MEDTQGSRIAVSTMSVRAENIIMWSPHNVKTIIRKLPEKVTSARAVTDL